MNVLKEELRGDVYTITLNRPEKKNALSMELLGALFQSLGHAEEKGSSIVIIRGAGGTFSAGGDITEFMSFSGSEAMSTGMELLNRSILRIRKLNAIVIAVLEGVVAGAAVGLSLSCDLSVAARTAKINLAFRRIGLAPDAGSSLLLGKRIGAKRFNELFLFARNMDMEEAKALGLVNFVWEEEKLEESLDEMIAELQALPMEPISSFKALENTALFSELEAQLVAEAAANSALVVHPSFKKRLEQLFTRR